MRIVGSHIEAKRIFSIVATLHEPLTFLVEHWESWDIYNHLRKLARWCPCWCLKSMKQFLEMEDDMMEKNEELIDKIGFLELEKTL